MIQVLLKVVNCEVIRVFKMFAVTRLALFVVYIHHRAIAQSDGKFWWMQPGSGFGITSKPTRLEVVTENPPQVYPVLATQSAPEQSAVLTAVPPAVLTEIFGTPPPAPPGTNNDNDEDCICIEFYLCQNGTINQYGVTALEPRIGIRAECTGIQVCCKPPRTETSTDSTDTRTSATNGECGIRRGNSATVVSTNWVRILDTSSASNSTLFGEFPWMLAILRFDETDPEVKMFQCGASLIHPQVALTAAHCVHKQPKEELKVRAGEWDMSDKNEPLPHQDKRIATIVVHDEFNTQTLFNDIALLVLDSPFELADNVGTICLPDPEDKFDDARCIATGWGRDSFGLNGKYRTTLNKVDLPVVPRHQCERKLQTTRLSQFFKLHDSFMCAGGEPGKDTCQGDGGGPLVCPSADDLVHYTQVGVVSWGIGCGDSDTPAVYADITQQVKWIKKQFQELGIKI